MAVKAAADEVLLKKYLPSLLLVTIAIDDETAAGDGMHSELDPAAARQRRTTGNTASE